jgi:hypothetical protein
MPIQTVFDLSFHPGSRTLVAASHGRSQWKLDLSTWPLAAGAPTGGPRLALSPPAPNPSHGPVALLLDLGGASDAEVAIYDAAGRLVRTLHSGAAGAPRIALTWNGLDERGQRAGAGVYFVRALTRTSAGGGFASSIQRVVRID